MCTFIISTILSYFKFSNVSIFTYLFFLFYHILYIEKNNYIFISIIFNILSDFGPFKWHVLNNHNILDISYVIEPALQMLTTTRLLPAPWSNITTWGRAGCRAEWATSTANGGIDQYKNWFRIYRREGSY